MKRITLFLSLIAFALMGYSQGYYIEMKLTSAKEGEMGTMKVYSQNGDSRSQMQMSMRGVNLDLSYIFLKSTPNTIYMLNEKDKTYYESTVNDDESFKDYPQNEYEVTVVGKEKVNGYNSTHVKIKVKGQTHEQEMWTTTEIGDYAGFSQIKTKYTGRGNLFKALEAKGATGFPVRMKMLEGGNAITIDVVKAEKRTNPSTLFSLAGYTKSSKATFSPGGIDTKELMEKMKNMTPEERQKWIEEMQKKYQQQPK